VIVRFQDSFKDICQTNFSLTQDEVRSTVFNPISKAVVKAGGSSRVYFFGSGPSSSSNPETNYHLLVEGQWAAPNLNIIAAFKVFEDILVGCKDREPITVVKALTTKFGIPIQIGGGFEDTFIQSKSFELKDKQDRIMKISTEKKRGHFAQTMHSSFRHEEDGRTFLDVSLAYCLDIDKMVEHLKNRRRN
jgi:hypothetical protein